MAHHRPNLRGINPFVPIIYFINCNEDCIKNDTTFGDFQMGVLKSPNYEFCGLITHSYGV